MSLLIVPLHPRYHGGAEALIRAAAPERSECVRSWPTEEGGAGEGDTGRRDYVAVDANDAHRVIGYGAIWRQGEGRFRMDLMVAPDRRRQGVGEALLQSLLAELRAQHATIVQVRTPDYRSDTIAFLMRRGFTETNRMIRLRLNVASASLAALPALTERPGALGITVVTLEQEQAQTADWLPKLLELFRATGPERVGNPYGGGADTEFWSLDVARQVWESTRILNAGACFLARKDDAYVGLSFLCPGEAPDVLAQGETGVHADWRRRGIATLLKLHTIAYAQQHGCREITTMTASPGMLALNEQLGFKSGWAEVRLVRQIERA